MPRLSRCDAGTRADAEQRHRHRNLGALGELPDDRRGVRQDDAVAGEDDRPLRRVDQLQGAGDRRRVHDPLRAGVRLGRRGLPVEVARRLLRVLGDVDQHRTGTAAGRDVERFAHRRRQILRPRHQVVVLGDRQRDAGDVGLLEAIAANQLAADLAGDADDRNGVHHRGGDARHHVGGAGARGGNRHADLAAGARVAVGHVRGALFVAHQHVADRVVEHRIVRRQDRAARIPEDGRDPFTDQAFPEDLCAGAFHGVARLLSCCAAHAVIAPCAADDTSRAYFPITPEVARCGGAGSCASRSASSVADTSTLSVRAVRSKVMTSPSRTARDRPAPRRFRRDVTGHQPAGRPGEAAVGDERHRIAQPGAHDGGGHAQHLAHARAAARPFVADDDDVARLDRAGAHGLERRFFAVEHARRAGMALGVVAGDLHHRAFRREIALEDDQAAGRLDRVRQRPHDDLVRRFRRFARVLADRPPGDRHRVGMQMSAFEQPPRDERDAAGAMQIGGDEAATRLEIREQRHTRVDAVEVFDVERHLRFVGDGEQVQHGVGRAAGGGDGGDGVLERVARDDLPRPHAALQHVHHHGAGARAPRRPCRRRSPECWRCRTARCRGSRTRSPSCWR